jgi:hypothetical protein
MRRKRRKPDGFSGDFDARPHLQVEWAGVIGANPYLQVDFGELDSSGMADARSHLRGAAMIPYHGAN